MKSNIVYSEHVSDYAKLLPLGLPAAAGRSSHCEHGSPCSNGGLPMVHRIFAAAARLWQVRV